MSTPSETQRADELTPLEYAIVFGVAYFAAFLSADLAEFGPSHEGNVARTLGYVLFQSGVFGVAMGVLVLRARRGPGLARWVEALVVGWIASALSLQNAIFVDMQTEFSSWAPHWIVDAPDWTQCSAMWAATGMGLALAVRWRGRLIAAPAFAWPDALGRLLVLDLVSSQSEIAAVGLRRVAFELLRLFVFTLMLPAFERLVPWGFRKAGIHTRAEPEPEPPSDPPGRP